MCIVLQRILHERRGGRDDVEVRLPVERAAIGAEGLRVRRLDGGTWRETAVDAEQRPRLDREVVNSNGSGEGALDSQV